MEQKHRCRELYISFKLQRFSQLPAGTVGKGRDIIGRLRKIMPGYVADDLCLQAWILNTMNNILNDHLNAGIPTLEWVTDNID